MSLLQEEASLNEIVKMVGMDALSPGDRLKMEAARSIREDFLHQDAFHEVDTYSPLEKQYRMMKLVLGDVTQNGNAIEFADSDSVSDYAKDAIAYLSSLSIVKGSQTDTGLLVNPTSQITREEAVAILNRVYDAILALN